MGPHGSKHFKSLHVPNQLFHRLLEAVPTQDTIFTRFPILTLCWFCFSVSLTGEHMAVNISTISSMSTVLKIWSHTYYRLLMVTLISHCSQWQTWILQSYEKWRTLEQSSMEFYDSENMYGIPLLSLFNVSAGHSVHFLKCYSFRGCDSFSTKPFVDGPCNSPHKCY